MFFDEFASFPQAELFSTFPGFHDTLHRYTEFEESVQLDKANRASSVDKEINFVRRMLPEIQQSIINKTNESIPQRVTHNDLKIDNILFSKANNSPICIVDLDTIMPGCIADDFGDAFRFAVTYSTENTVDLSKVYIDQHLFKMFASGFWKKCGASLTNMEKSILLEQSKILTLECGMRMLTDYIQGDVYFPIECPEHNLIRCRARFKLVHEIERQWDKLQCAIDHMDWFF